MFLLCGHLLGVFAESHFKFPTYTYKKKAFNEQIYRKSELLCSPNCTSFENFYLAHIKCIRECLNAACYKEIYGFDELEEGEIDVRFHSFKGCVLRDLKRSGFRVI